MALVDEGGRHWYKAVPLYEPLHPWVAENVVPVIGNAVCLERPEFSASLAGFLRAYDAVHLIADWPEDIKFFCEALITGPGQRIGTPPLAIEIRRDLDAESSVPHNALADAQAICALYMGNHA
jgi:hypothetical protein